MDLEGSTSLETIPAAHSFLDANALLALIARVYALDPPIDCILLRHSWNDSYQLVTRNTRYIVRISGVAWHTLSEIQFEIDLLRYLAQQNAPVAAPILRRDGQPITKLQTPEGIRYLALFPYAVGEVPAIPIGNQDQSYHFGRALAAIHAAADTFHSSLECLNYDLEALLDRPIAVLRPYLSHRVTDWHYLVEVGEELRAGVAKLLAHGLDWGIIHGDPLSANACITSDYQVTWYDFEFCGFGWRALDLAHAYASAQDHEDNSALVWNAFLKGYRSKRPISETDLAAMPFLSAAADIWSMGINLMKGPVDGFECFDDVFFDNHLTWLRESVAIYRGMGGQRATDPN
jgi:Ser/Thr protein kinase RdoA (MazF antagonist)